MRGHKRKYYPDGFDHIFQHALEYRVLFYSLEDRLVFYTIFSVLAWRYEVTVLTLALMYNHFHSLIHASTPKVRSLFIGTLTSTYAMAFNRDTGRKGALFEKAYGNSPKSVEKKIRTCIAYNFNNSVEKGLYFRAEEDRWNFLAYINNDHPFSKPIIQNRASAMFRNRMKEVDAHVRDHAYLGYLTVRRLFRDLNGEEREQLTDYIISRYLPFDKALLLSFYKDYDSMVLAINSNTGSEYDIKEEYRPDSDCAYTQMLQIVSQSSYADNPHSIVSALPEKKQQIAMQLKKLTGAKDYQIARLLHL
jgi:REP element-mobilizing transposase RayT